MQMLDRVHATVKSSVVHSVAASNIWEVLSAVADLASTMQVGTVVAFAANLLPICHRKQFACLGGTYRQRSRQVLQVSACRTACV
jgi:hypothetical protein